MCGRPGDVRHPPTAPHACEQTWRSAAPSHRAARLRCAADLATCGTVPPRRTLAMCGRPGD
eukprot:1528516-Prymnesium_polylepis.1